MKRHVTPLAIVVLATVLAACGGGSGSLGSLPPGGSAEPSTPVSSPDATPGGGSPAPSPTGPSSSPNPSNPPGTPAPAEKMIVRAYFYLDGEPGSMGLVPVLRSVPKTTAVARAAIEQLLLGPSADEQGASPAISSAVPEGTGLLGIRIESGTATVDFSGEFASGGGTHSTLFRLAQVTYTLTQFPTVQRVIFWIDGRPVTVFGSEGLVLDGPQARDDYRDQLPSIWVDRPAWGAAFGNPGRVDGLANVFEAQFLVSLLDAEGRVLFDGPVMATCGTGCWGTFDVTIAYDVPEAQWGTLRTYNLSAADGSVESVREYPVWLTPGG